MRRTRLTFATLLTLITLVGCQTTGGVGAGGDIPLIPIPQAGQF